MARIEAFGVGFDTDSITMAHKLIAGAVVSVLILGSGAWFMLKPQYDAYQALQDDIAKQETEIHDKELKVKNLDALKKELKAIEARLATMQNKIPHDANVAPLLVDLEDMTENQALYGNSAVLSDFKPGGIVDFTLPPELSDAAGSETAKQLKQLPVSIHLTKISYPDLIKLLTDYESYERTLSLEGLSITPVEDANALYTPVDVSFTLKTFLLVGGAPAPAAGAPAAAGAPGAAPTGKGG